MDATDATTQATLLRVATEKLAKVGGDGTLDQRMKMIFRDIKNVPETMPAAEAEEFKVAVRKDVSNTDEMRSILIKLAVGKGYDPKSWSVWKENAKNIIENELKNGKYANAVGKVIDGSLLFNEDAVKSAVGEKCKKLLKRYESIYVDVCETETKSRMIKEKWEQWKVEMPTMTLDDATKKYAGEEASLIANKTKSSRKATREPKDDAAIAAAVAASFPPPPAKEMPVDVVLVNPNTFTDGVTAISFDEVMLPNGTPVTRITVSNADKEGKPEIIINNDTKRNMCINIKSGFVLTAKRFLIQYTLVDPLKVFFATVTYSGNLKNLGEYKERFNFDKLGSKSFVATGYDRTNTNVRVFELDEGNITPIGKTEVPFAVASIKVLPTTENTVLIEAVDGTKHAWTFAAPAVVNAGAGAEKPGFATEMLKALPEDDDSVLDGASSQGMAEDA